VTFTIGEEVKTASLALLTTADNTMDEVCASEAIIDLQATAFEAVASALSVRDFARATDANAKAVAAIEALFDFETTPDAVKQTIVATLKELEDQAQAIVDSRDDYTTARETELRALSRSSTNRNSGASLDPTGGRTLSELQSQLIGA
jgi:hypothetical protein